MDKRFWSVVALLILLFCGIVIGTGHNSKNGNLHSTGQPTSHIEGSAKSGIKLVEYGDYECYYCGQFYPVVKNVMSQYQDRIQFQFRNLPLSQVHKNATAGAKAAEAASLQGKFWQMHDLLYENQDPNEASGWVVSSDPLNDYFVGFARQLGLDTVRFSRDFASDSVNNTIDADMAAFKRTGASIGTPTFFLNGKLIKPNSYSVAAFQKYIDPALAAANH